MSDSKVLIVGAGPTGLVLALQLAHQRIPFRIIEKNTGPGQASRAIAMHARILEFYQQLGFGDEVVKLGIKMEAMHIRAEGKEIAKVEFKDIGKGLSPYPFVLSFPQDDHERFLVDKLKHMGVEVEWGVELKQFTQDGENVRAVLVKSGKQETCVTSYLCGCDGAHSLVRQGLKLDFPGGTYSQIFYVADVKIEGDFNKDLHANFRPDNLGLILPVRSSGMQRLIGIVPEELNNHNNLTFEDIRPSAESIMGIRITQVNWFSTYHVHHRVAPHFQVGRCFIAGDAGHIHSPAGGQGMNTGIGDAVNLSWKLAQVIQGRAAPSLLDSYEPERIAFARVLVNSTDRTFRNTVSRGWWGELLRRWLIPNVMPILTKFSIVRRMIFLTVSQIRINYHESPLSQGTVGKIKGGDRLPWVAGSGDGNYSPLCSLDWQVHIYGEASQEFSDAAQQIDLPVHIFSWDKLARKAGLKQNAVYLIRPDGHIALALPTPNVQSLKDFMNRHGLRFTKSNF